MCNYLTSWNVRSGIGFFEIVPDYDLNLMQANQTLNGLS
jgi:hypothetical protein